MLYCNRNSRFDLTGLTKTDHTFELFIHNAVLSLLVYTYMLQDVCIEHLTVS